MLGSSQGWSRWCSPCQPRPMSHPQSDSPLSPVSGGEPYDSQASPVSPVSPVSSTPLDPSASGRFESSTDPVSAQSAVRVETVESADSSSSPAIVGPLGPVGRVTAASYSGASAAAVAFPDPARRPYPDPRPAGSAVSASSALHAVLEDSEEGTLMDTLGMEVVNRDADRTEVRMPVEGARQVVGILHGGATAALIETAASVAARAAAPDGAMPVGAELTVSHLRSVTRGWVKATAVPLHRGRRTVVYQVTVADEDERTIAVGTLRSLFT